MDAESREFLDNYVSEIVRTLAGHWHPNTVECTSSCPMGDPVSAPIFADMLIGASLSLTTEREMSHANRLQL